MKTFKQPITKTIALAGNPNSGKSTLFNLLTGSRQHIGNWPGVTVERKEGRLTADPSVQVVDLPGIYSLTPLSIDEKVANDFLQQNKPDLIVNIVDSTALERGLFLTTQLLEMGTDVVVALNMLDELEAGGMKIDTDKLAEIYGVKFFLISSSRKKGIKEMVSYIRGGKIAKPKPVKITKTAQDEIAEERYAQIGAAVRQVLARPSEDTVKKVTLSDKIDKIVTNRWLAFPIFALIMAAIFYLSIDKPGGWITDFLNETAFPWITETVVGWIEPVLPAWLTALIGDGIFAGVFAVLGFVPQIMILFALISLLEASGYMSRIAFIMDRLLSKIGLNGRSFVTLILGCGCAVPAIMATRTIKNVRERNNTITLAPMMPCSAKLAIFAFFTSYIFDGNAWIALSLYFLSIVVIILGGLVLKVIQRKKRDPADVFVMELPSYRAPQWGNVLRESWERGKSFIVRAGTVIFASSVVLWFLQSFNFSFIMVEANESILAALGRVLAPLFVPLGWGQWQFAVASITGFIAKETVVTTLEILFGTEALAAGAITSHLAAYSFLAFNLLSVPCMAAVSASFREQGKARNGWFSVAFQMVTAYVVALIIYQLGTLVAEHATVFWTVIVILLIAIALFFTVRALVKEKTACACGCAGCPLESTCASKSDNKKQDK